jgi:glycosyltransferase involved in cell wall biosynthesis
MGQAGRKLVNENYSWQIVGERLHKLYLEIASKKVSQTDVISQVF